MQVLGGNLKRRIREFSETHRGTPHKRAGHFSSQRTARIRGYDYCRGSRAGSPLIESARGPTKGFLVEADVADLCFLSHSLMDIALSASFFDEMARRIASHAAVGLAYEGLVFLISWSRVS